MAAGLVRITDARLRPGGNQDRKRTLTQDAVSEISWIWPDPVPMPENTILALDAASRDSIFAAGSGQARINELLRRVQLKILRRSVILAVAQQEDSMKRPRDARSSLRPEGILIFGHLRSHREVARALGVEQVPGFEALPDKGEFLAVRVVAVEEGDSRPKAQLADKYWAIATEFEPAEEGPKIATRGQEDES